MTTLVIGVGNEYRGDDGVGRRVVRDLGKLKPEGVTLRESNGESFALIEMWSKAEKVILVDATHSGAEPGTVCRFDAGEVPLPAEVLASCSTHAASVPEAIELARSLGRLPTHVVFYGIEGLHFDHGCSLSSYAQRASTEVVERIQEELIDPDAAASRHRTTSRGRVSETRSR